MARDSFCCQRCKRAGQLTQATEVDHIIPVAAGGTDDDGNLEAICHDCHILKGAEDAKTYGWAGRPTPGG
jgi:5-methylcytosine-specific restriction protein A